MFAELKNTYLHGLKYHGDNMDQPKIHSQPPDSEAFFYI